MSFYLKVKLLVLLLSYGIPSEPCSSKLRLIVLLSNRMTLGIHAQKSEIPYSTKGKGKTWRDELKIHF